MNSKFEADIFKINRLKEMLPDSVSLTEYLEFKILENVAELNEREGEVHDFMYGI